MKKRSFFAAALAAFFWALPAAAGSFDARVIGIVDGDTLDVLHEAGGQKTPIRVRLVGIDAPEKAQPFGTAAREQLSRLAFGRDAALRCVGDAERYGRSLCVVHVEGIDVGHRLVELGYAWHFKRYAATQRREEAASYAVSEEAARTARSGLWRDLETAAIPVPPWEWRTLKR